MISKKSLFAVKFIFFIVACSSSARANNEEYIAEFNGLVDQVTKPLAPAEIADKFQITGGPIEKAKIIFLGEQHTNADALFDKLHVLATLLKPGDIILTEGTDAGKPTQCVFKILDVLSARAWKKTGRTYDPGEYDKFNASRLDLFFPNVTKLNFTKLPLPLQPFGKTSACSGWDDRSQPKLSIYALGEAVDGIMKRNVAMIGAIKANMDVSVLGRIKGLLTGSPRIFIQAGMNHLPAGDLESFKDYMASASPDRREHFAKQFGKEADSKFYQNLDEATYFQHIIQARKAQAERRPSTLELFKELFFGTSREIYAYIKDKPYVELIPKSLASLKEMCTDECN